jgi:hypothetical protein
MLFCHWRTPGHRRVRGKGLSPPLELSRLVLISADSFLPEQADTGCMKGAHCEAFISDS